MRSLLVVFILTFSSYASAECGYHVDGTYKCGSNCGYKADGKFRCGSNCGYKADGKFRCNKSQAKDSPNDNCGYKADGKYHCGKIADIKLMENSTAVKIVVTRLTETSGVSKIFSW